MTYLYALARATGIEAPDVRGVADAPLRTLTHADLGCVVSSVPAADFGDEVLQTRLDDLGWLERTAREHDRVVQACAQLTTVVPLRLATVFTDDRSVLSRLDTVRVSALDALSLLDGREEWGLKMYAATPAVEADPAETAGTTGTAYLRRRRAEHSQRSAVLDHAVRDAEVVFAALADHAVRAHRHRPQDPRLSGDPRPMVLNAAFLIDRVRVEDFRARVADLAEQRPPGSVLLTGPWPAYSFASLDES